MAKHAMPSEKGFLKEKIETIKEDRILPERDGICFF